VLEQTFATGEDDYTRSLCAKANCGTGYVCKIHEGHGRVLKGGGSSGDSSSSNKGHDGNQNEQVLSSLNKQPALSLIARKLWGVPTV
jgi:hypothetical protein